MTLFVIIFIWKRGLFSVEQNKESKKSKFFIFKKKDQWVMLACFVTVFSLSSNYFFFFILLNQVTMTVDRLFFFHPTNGDFMTGCLEINNSSCRPPRQKSTGRHGMKLHNRHRASYNKSKQTNLVTAKTCIDSQKDLKAGFNAVMQKFYCVSHPVT